MAEMRMKRMFISIRMRPGVNYIILYVYLYLNIQNGTCCQQWKGVATVTKVMTPYPQDTWEIIKSNKIPKHFQCNI